MIEDSCKRGNLNQLGRCELARPFYRGVLGGSAPKASLCSAVPRLTQDLVGILGPFWICLRLIKDD